MFKALTGGDPSTVQVVPSFYFSEQGYSDSEEEEAALEEWKELDAQIPVMTPEIWNTLPQEVRDQGLYDECDKCDGIDRRLCRGSGNATSGNSRPDDDPGDERKEEGRGKRATKAEEEEEGKPVQRHV